MKNHLVCGILALAPLFAQSGTFELRIDRATPYTRTYLGNGRLGVSTSPLGTAPTETYMAGLYDQAEGDVPRIAALPAWNEVDWFDGRAWLSQTPSGSPSVRSYSQVLNMCDGALQTRYSWEDQDRETSFDVEMFVSRANPDLAVLKFQVTPHQAGPVRATFSLRAWPAPGRVALARLEKVDPKITQQDMWYPGHMVVDDRGSGAAVAGWMLHMTSHPEGGVQSVAEAVSVAWPAGLPGLAKKGAATPSQASLELSFDAAAGVTYTFYKYAAVRRASPSTGAAGEAASASAAAALKGYDALFRDSSGAWHKLWETDIVADTDPALQRVIHSMLFYLLASAQADSDTSIPPMGLSTGGYYGHVFWDADTYLFPALMVLHPEFARPIVMFRYRALEAASENARRNGWKGAMYPWEAGPDGAETTPRFAWQNATSEIHVNGDVALAQWQYYLATGDKDWLANYGFPVIKSTADFWVSRATYVPENDRYEIRNVVSWIESRVGVDNDPYTNAVAALNLRLADTAARLLNLSTDPAWRKIGRKMYLPEGTTLLESYPLGRQIGRHAKETELDEAIRGFRAGQFGVMMGITFYPILAVEAGDRARLDEVLPFTYKPYLMPDFNVLREVPDNSNINFLTGAGGFLQQFVFGYTGLRFSEEGLTRKYTPMLPSEIRKLVLKNVTVRGSRRDIVVPETATP